jgi:hypothetical protein
LHDIGFVPPRSLRFIGRASGRPVGQVPAIDAVLAREEHTGEVPIGLAYRMHGPNADVDDSQKLVLASVGNEARSLGVQIQSWDGAPAVFVTVSASQFLDQLGDLASPALGK